MIKYFFKALTVFIILSNSACSDFKEIHPMEIIDSSSIPPASGIVVFSINAIRENGGNDFIIWGAKFDEATSNFETGCELPSFFANTKGVLAEKYFAFLLPAGRYLIQGKFFATDILQYYRHPISILFSVQEKKSVYLGAFLANIGSFEGLHLEYDRPSEIIDRTAEKLFFARSHFRLNADELILADVKPFFGEAYPMGCGLNGL